MCQVLETQREEMKALTINERGRCENQYKIMKLNITAYSHSSPSEIREERPMHSLVSLGRRAPRTQWEGILKLSHKGRWVGVWIFLV